MDTWIASGEYKTALSLSKLNVNEEESGVDTCTETQNPTVLEAEPTPLTSTEAPKLTQQLTQWKYQYQEVVATLLKTGNHPTVTRILLWRKRCSNVDCVDYVLYY